MSIMVLGAFLWGYDVLLHLPRVYSQQYIHRKGLIFHVTYKMCTVYVYINIIYLFFRQRTVVKQRMTYSTILTERQTRVQKSAQTNVIHQMRAFYSNP